MATVATPGTPPPTWSLQELLTGRAPNVRRAFRLLAHGTQRDLRPVDFAGTIRVDLSEDPFVAMIEQRLQLAATAAHEGVRLALKTIANSGAYGSANPTSTPRRERPITRPAYPRNPVDRDTSEASSRRPRNRRLHPQRPRPPLHRRHRPQNHRHQTHQLAGPKAGQPLTGLSGRVVAHPRSATSPAHVSIQLSEPLPKLAGRAGNRTTKRRKQEQATLWAPSAPPR